MIKLRYSSGKLLSPEVHKIGIMAIGSHLENHGAALPIDTDSKIASYLAFQASIRTGAKFIGILYAATEYDYVKHGVHMSADDLVKKELIPTLNSARNNLNLEAVVLVNGHGGNVPIKDYLADIEKELGIRMIFNNRIVEIEGPHAGTGELSMGVVLGMADESRLNEHCQFEEYPEVGMVGLPEARQQNKGIDDGACQVENEGIVVDLEVGENLLETAITDIVKDVQSILN
ncbi:MULTISPECIES: 2-amino-5-formylamino-6-ribosylaminopyrimidin-4(3H)-one 5'-monophosphate deformylase [Methanobacterium]|jgi:2-amino-5-formylamino-6-ribosylaminopyrimidin-4(3H)-one 5'-monophosphate deformylase|uniref:2-amino-5-formylamino-6-ribosylaminopyrimidin-4(3H)-one 5'-monophosphate deformylase n=1 Tax=Methanobacterium subterraneum TaxID=59277 RepID=A0A7K4DN53_9EURY|nr:MULTISPECIES: 2-amino-5-formylamino-6-ribosylaminopyrimidin-4(3H)-one 5'-monophosphate deformylase [Methanobacterium]AUB58154.1 creatinine amidohydrolase [Methanobacterium sp. MZ-A1]MBW4256793.1 2-amino-5-formylamino-6-ribosylaminopyrimidin-4(3H)-one 5'-monophosphate deformylase [Methanobacterium sp. YSL]NMO09749.1 2-amino-5-formylamino-6-ribosylaminopyrimidin-4(3H)-one 5'-monophosphate deformylase [Methanobacterium subterraneum]